MPRRFCHYTFTPVLLAAQWPIEHTWAELELWPDSVNTGFENNRVKIVQIGKNAVIAKYMIQNIFDFLLACKAGLHFYELLKDERLKTPSSSQKPNVSKILRVSQTPTYEHNLGLKKKPGFSLSNARLFWSVMLHI